jgi:ribose transport system substrate-binding protein
MICLSLAFLVSACGGSGSNSGGSNADKYKFAVVEAVVNPFYTPFPQALDDVSKAESIPVPLLGAPQNFDQTQENTIIDGFVAKGIKALGVQPVDAVAGNQTIKRLVQQHINVVTFGSCSKTQEAGAIYCLQSDVKKAAYIATKNLIQTIGGKGKIVHLAGQVADTSTAPRIAGVEQAVSEASGVTLLQTISDIDSAEAAQNAVSNLLAAKRTQIDGIVSTAYNPSVAMANELRRLNETRIKGVAIDTDPIVLKAIKDGFLLATQAGNPYEQAYISVLSMKYLADGCKWKDNSASGFLVDAPYLYTTKDTVDSLAQAEAEATKKIASSWKSTYWTC